MKEIIQTTTNSDSNTEKNYSQKKTSRPKTLNL